MLNFNYITYQFSFWKGQIEKLGDLVKGAKILAYGGGSIFKNKILNK
jgi:alcohol dehydrogenase YqhD (iron-dependent ADH family)